MLFALPTYSCGENSRQRFQLLLSFKYVCFQDKKHKVHKLRKTFQAGGPQHWSRAVVGCSGPGAALGPGRCFAYAEYETEKLTIPLKLQLDLGQNARTHLPLMSAI